VTELLVSGVVTLLGAPLVLRLARSQGIIDVPNARSSHTTPVPRGGGLACLAGIVVAAVVAHSQGRVVPWHWLLPVLVLTAIGFVDDHRSLSAVSRLAAQVAAGSYLGWVAGGGWWVAAGAVLAVAVVNIVNFMDGINGITSLTMAVWGITAFAVGQSHAVPSLSLVGALAAGSALGFLPWNFPTARLFLGDAGSYLFGAMAAVGLLIGWSEGVPVVLLAAPLALYLADTTTVLARRVLRGDSLFEAHRDHVYQRLTSAAGLSHPAVSLGVAILSAAITISWMAPVMWVPLATTALVCGAYLSAPKLVGNRATTAAWTEGGTE